MFLNQYPWQQIPPPIPPGRFHFERVRDIGAGGLGRVDEIVVTASNQSIPVGTRLARKRLNANWENHPEARQRFEQEIQALKRMSHQNIITVSGENIAASTERFYVMPLYERSLRDALAANPNGFRWTVAAEFIAAMADAMAYAHSAGFIHRDLKPENILLATNKSAAIADWGLGYFVHKNSKVLQHLTRGGMGTEYYCSIEQWNTGKCDATGDIYSLGMVLAELIHGRQSDIFVGMGITEDVVHNNTHGARMLNHIIKQMTDLIQTRRLQSMREVTQQLRSAVSFATTPL